MRSLLSDEAVAAGLAQLAGWQQEGSSIRKIHRFPSFREAMKFVHRVADLAEEVNHHPDISIQHEQVTLVLSSHDLGGISERDLSFARTLEG